MDLGITKGTMTNCGLKYLHSKYLLHFSRPICLLDFKISLHKIKPRKVNNFILYSRNSQVSQIDNEDYSTLRTFNFPEFSPLAFKTVFEYLIGYSSMMKDCTNFLELCEMLRLVDYLIIPKLIKMIRDKIRQLPLDASNVINAYEASHDLYCIERYKGTAASLQDRCIAYCGANLASWQGLISFIVDNQDYLASVMELIEHLGEEKECIIRYVPLCSYN